MASGTQDPDAEPDEPGPGDPAERSQPDGDTGTAGPSTEQGAEQGAEPVADQTLDPAGDGSGASGDPEDVWRAIVANYGDRPVLDEPDGAAQPGLDPGPAGPRARPGATDPDARLRRLFEPLDRPPPDRGSPEAPGRADRGDEADLARSPDAPFVPPTPPPLPPTTADRRAAWLGALVAPVVLLLSLVLSVDLPQVVALGLVAWFAGGFCYLVLTMSREPRDPGDDGARV